jgi:hypothetical protein
MLQGFAVGALAVVLAWYGLRPNHPYPQWMLAPYEHPWLVPILILAIAAVFSWDARVGAMLILVALAVVLDVHLFGRPMDLPTRTDPALPAGMPMRALSVGDAIGSVYAPVSMAPALKAPTHPIAMDVGEHLAPIK